MPYDPREPSPRGYDPPQRSKSLNAMPLATRTTVLLRQWMYDRIERGGKPEEGRNLRAMLAALARFQGENPMGVQLAVAFLTVKVPVKVAVRDQRGRRTGEETKQVKADMARIQFQLPDLGPIGWLPMVLVPTNPTLKRIAHEGDPASVPVLPLAPWESSEGEEKKRVAFPPKPGTFLFRGKRG